MPGPVSDSFDPEFGTGANTQDIRDAIGDVVAKLEIELGPRLKNIIAVVNGPEGKIRTLMFTEQELRVMRFALNRALETI